MRTYEATIILVQQTERNSALSLQEENMPTITNPQDSESRNQEPSDGLRLLEQEKNITSKYLEHKEENTNTGTYVSPGRHVKSNPVRQWHKARNGSYREEDWYQNCK